MADTNFTDSDLKVLKLFGETLKSLINEFNQGNKAISKMEQNYAKVSNELGIFSEVLTRAQKDYINNIKNITGVNETINAWQQQLLNQSRQLAKFNEKYADSDVAGATLDLEKVLNTKKVEQVLIKALNSSIDSTVDYFSGSLSEKGQDALKKIVLETKKIGKSEAVDMADVVAEVQQVRKESGLITEEIKKQATYTQQTLYGTRELNANIKNTSKKKKQDAQETLEVEKKITKELEKQTEVKPKKKRGRKSKKVEAVEQPKVEQPASPEESKNNVPFKLGALVPHPKYFKTLVNPMTPLGISGSVNSDRGERIKRVIMRNVRDRFYVHNMNKGAISMGTSAPPVLGLPQYTSSEWAAREAKIASDNNLGLPQDTIEDNEEALRRQQHRDAALRRLKSRGAYQVAGTGSKTPIMLGTASSAEGENSINSFKEQEEKEEGARNRRKFVADLATAILAVQKKNPLMDIIRYAILTIGKHFPVLSAALLTLAPLIGIFKGASVLRALLTGGKVTKNAPLAARIASGIRNSDKAKALFGFGPQSIGTRLGVGLGSQIVSGFKSGGIRGALTHGVQALGVNMRSLPLVQKSANLFQNTARVANMVGRHPAWMTRIGGAALARSAGNVAMGAGRLALGAGKLAFRGLASPIMIGIDALCGFLATQGGKWWQRLAGMFLKVITLGFMSDKRIRQIVGIQEETLQSQQKGIDDEERRHQERIGWWDRFWAWLKNILPWAKGDDPTKKGDQTEAPVLGGADTDKAIKDATEEKKNKLNSARYKVNTKEFQNALDEYKKEYALKEARNTLFANDVKRDNFIREKMASDEAHDYAIKKIAEEKKGLQNEIQRAETVAKGGAVQGPVLASSTGGKYGKGTFAGHNVTSSFGKRNTGIAGASTDHKGIDLDYKYENVGAFAAGKVIFAGQQKKNGKLTGYGNYVVVQDAGGMKHTYGHLDKINVKKGQQVALGQSIGISGNTGTSGGAHLHYGVQDKNNRFLNPLAVASSSSKDYLEALKNSDAAATQTGTATSTNTATNEKVAVASSDIRDGLAAIVGAKGKNAKQERARNIIFNSAVDVTGSLGVWGITQLNNGVMNVGK